MSFPQPNLFKTLPAMITLRMNALKGKCSMDIHMDYGNYTIQKDQLWELVDGIKDMS